MALLRQLLSTAGDGTGTTDGGSNSSVTPVELSCLPAASQEYRVDSLVVLIEDNAALLGDVFGSAALTNGIRIRVLNGDDVTLLNVDAGVPIKRLGDLLALGATVEADASGTNKFAAYTLHFPQPVVLNGNTPSRLAVTLNDDLSNLVTLQFMALGIKRGQVAA